MSTRDDVLHGTLDLLVLRVLRSGPLHGWAIHHRLRDLSDDRLQTNQGSLYPALHRLERDGSLESHWGTSEANRRAKFYSLTDRGEKRLGAEEAGWRRFVDAVELVLARA